MMRFSRGFLQSCVCVMVLWSVDQSTAQAKATGLVADFQSEKHLQGFDKPWVSSGCFAVEPDVGLVWRIEKPFSARIEVSAAGIRSVSASGQIRTLKGDALPTYKVLRQSLVAALLGQWGQLSPMFTVTEVPTVEGYRVKLVPAVANIPFRSLGIQGKQHVEVVRMENLAGDVDTMIFSDHRRVQATNVDELSAFVQRCH